VENLWAPWRMEYILGKREPYCIFCPEGNGLGDEERLILHRGRLCMVMMNKYPYNNGHLLIAPWRHVASLEDLTTDESLANDEMDATIHHYFEGGHEPRRLQCGVESRFGGRSGSGGSSPFPPGSSMAGGHQLSNGFCGSEEYSRTSGTDLCEAIAQIQEGEC